MFSGHRSVVALHTRDAAFVNRTAYNRPRRHPGTTYNRPRAPRRSAPDGHGAEPTTRYACSPHATRSQAHGITGSQPHASRADRFTASQASITCSVLAAPVTGEELSHYAAIRSRPARRALRTVRVTAVLTYDTGAELRHNPLAPQVCQTTNTPTRELFQALGRVTAPLKQITSRVQPEPIVH